MAPAKTDTAPITKQDLQNLSADLKSSFTMLIAQQLAPISQQLSDLTTTLKEVSSTAEAAMEIGLAAQEDTRNLQRSEQLLSSKVALLEAHIRASNLKFRGLPESPAFDANLASSLATWLASKLKLEDGVAPTILSAYRLGSPSAARPKFPRDVMAQFLYPRSRNAILQLARADGPLKFESHSVLVLLDLSPNVLAKRRLLKPITECLHSNKVRFRWSPTSDILVYKEGRQLRAEDIPSGKDLLLALNLQVPSDLATDPSSPTSVRGEG